MINAALTLVGVLIALGATITFRSIIIISQSPLFHIPIFFLVFGIEIIIISTGYSKLISFFKIKNPFNFSITLLSLYYPLFTVFLLYERTFLGLSFTSALPWYALTLYPALIFLPVTFSFTTLFKSLSYRSKTVFILFGLCIYYLADFIILWNLEVIYLSIFLSTVGFVILCFFSKESAVKVKYALIALSVIVLTYSPIPNKINFSIKSFVREFKTSLFENHITPYGELFIHRKNNKFLFSINHNRLFKHPDSINIQEMTHNAMLQYPWAESVLVIGEWREIIDEIMIYPNIKNIYWANTVPDIFNLDTDFLKKKFTYPEKLRIIRNSDPRSFLKKIRQEKIFDIVFISLPAPTNIFLNRYYSKEFFEELRSVVSDNSMISITLKTGEKNLSINHKFLSASILKKLPADFPNTLESYGHKSQILASYNRNFTTSYLALSEFLNAIENMPLHISKSLIKYKILSRDRIKDELSSPLSIINSDIKPISLRYSLNELLFTFGAVSYPLMNLLNNIKPVYIYLFFTIFLILLLKLFCKKEIELKLKIILFIASFIQAIFIYDLFLAIHSYTGQIFRYFSLILFSIIGGYILAILLFKKTNPKIFVSALRLVLLLTGIFMIILPSVFEYKLSIPSVPWIFVFSIISGILFGSINFLGINSSLKLFDNPIRIKKLHKSIFLGMMSAAAIVIFILPVFGIVDILPAIGIFSLGCVALISI